jgi:hypothetical protein
MQRLGKEFHYRHEFDHENKLVRLIFFYDTSIELL